MQSTTEDSAVLQKTKELCQAILDQPEYQRIRQGIDAFLANDDVRDHYQALSEKGEYLQHKQQTGGQLSDQEIAEFEKDRQSFLNNPVARGFLDAQQEMQQLHQAVSRLLDKTFELGRVPGPEDMEHGCCGDCGCH